MDPDTQGSGSWSGLLYWEWIRTHRVKGAGLVSCTGNGSGHTGFRELVWSPALGMDPDTQGSGSWSGLLNWEWIQTHRVQGAGLVSCTGKGSGHTGFRELVWSPALGIRTHRVQGASLVSRTGKGSGHTGFRELVWSPVLGRDLDTQSSGSWSGLLYWEWIRTHRVQGAGLVSCTGKGSGHTGFRELVWSPVLGMDPDTQGSGSWSGLLHWEWIRTHRVQGAGLVSCTGNGSGHTGFRELVWSPVSGMDPDTRGSGSWSGLLYRERIRTHGVQGAGLASCTGNGSRHTGFRELVWSPALEMDPDTGFSELVWSPVLGMDPDTQG
ncbi:hypothetical protein NDU88_007504 [Pleurodeles waltl]|uniref:Uncharacterized protein n=1 Tax=Pleurodeles waltl TaxID=8319 RepID=A0AAV7MFC5_PLEWA|nr:hypothetical protein NDU88_007504 [Pleurodeles waltl]